MNQSNRLSINEMHDVHKLIGIPIFKKELLFEEKKKRHALNTENIFIKKPKAKKQPKKKYIA